MGVTNTDAHFPTGVLNIVRFRVGNIDVVMRVEEDPARPAELCPLCKKYALLIEELNSAVGTIADEYTATEIDGNGVQRAELSGRISGLPPSFEESAICRKFHDAIVTPFTVAVSDEDGAVV